LPPPHTQDVNQCHPTLSKKRFWLGLLLRQEQQPICTYRTILICQQVQCLGPAHLTSSAMGHERRRASGPAAVQPHCHLCAKWYTTPDMGSEIRYMEKKPRAASNLLRRFGYLSIALVFGLFFQLSTQGYNVTPDETLESRLVGPSPPALVPRGVCTVHMTLYKPCSFCRPCAPSRMSSSFFPCLPGTISLLVGPHSTASYR